MAEASGDNRSLLRTTGDNRRQLSTHSRIREYQTIERILVGTRRTPIVVLGEVIGAVLVTDSCIHRQQKRHPQKGEGGKYLCACVIAGLAGRSPIDRY